MVLEGRSKSEVARDYDVSRQWVQQLVRRYQTEGATAFEPRSRRPHTNARAVGPELEDRIVRLRKTLSRRGLDAGADTIGAHLAADPSVTKVPAVSTIWRILTRRGFVTPQPHKRPRSSWKRFCAELPNHCWQADVTHWHLAHGGGVEILNILDDHSRLAIASLARRSIGGPDVVDTFTTAFTRWGTPASVLTDNGAIFTGAPRRGGRTALEITLGELGIRYLNSRPYHPQTCGKIERFHQTKRNGSQPIPPPPWPSSKHCSTSSPTTTTGCAHIDPIGTATPIQAFNARPKATATGYLMPAHCRVRTDVIDAAGVITIRYNSHLHHIGLSKRRRGTKVTVLIDDRDIRVLD
ncbi:MAG: hypothetical protein QOE94_2638, partial [Mycobacterium sp.]|nr:hypothetical protein [Mycobacterium sp.]